jgi:hypothetical protein
MCPCFTLKGTNVSFVRLEYTRVEDFLYDVWGTECRNKGAGFGGGRGRNTHHENRKQVSLEIKIRGGDEKRERGRR